MELISISEFQHLTKLNDSELLAMLENGELVTASGEAGELLIDISNLNTSTLALRTAERNSILSEDELAYIEETIATELISALTELFPQAWGIAMNWHSQTPKDTEET